MRRGLNTLQGYEQHRAEHFAVILADIPYKCDCRNNRHNQYRHFECKRFTIFCKIAAAMVETSEAKIDRVWGRWNVFQISRAAFAVV